MRRSDVVDSRPVLFDAACEDALSAVEALRKLGYQLRNPRTSGLTGRRSDGPAMSAEGMTFGLVISEARKALGVSQKELAARVLKEESGESISPQYLNDIEHDRRSPTSGHLIRQCCGILNIPEDYLFALAGRLKDDLRPYASTPDKVVEAFASFKKKLKE
jgi:transcriptional regulator with XRE-family HTH domain